MPKKNKKSANKQDEDKKTPEDSSVTAPDKAASDNSEKDLYLTQIRYLDEQLELYQLKCDELERQNSDLNSEYNALETQKKEKVEYLKRSLLQKEDEVDELKECLKSQRQDANKERDAMQLQHTQLSQELLNRTEEVTTENEALLARIAGLEEPQKQVEELKANVESLEKEHVCQKEEHKAEINSLEMKALQDKLRLDKDFPAELQYQVDKRIPVTTKLAFQESREVKARFSKMSEQTLVVNGENSTLKDRKNQLSLAVDNLDQMLSETSRQNCISKKVVQQLTNKCQQLQANLKGCRPELKQLQTEHTAALAEMEALRQSQASLSEQCSKTRAEESRLEAELQEERSRMSRMKSMMQDTAVSLRYILMEAPTEQDSEADSVPLWKQLIQKLLEDLYRPTLTNSNTGNDHLNEQPTSDPAAACEKGP